MTKHDRPMAVADIGGTNARFAIARRTEPPFVLDYLTVLETDDYPDFESAWHVFARIAGDEGVRSLAISFAGPVGATESTLTNGQWTISPERLRQSLGLDRVEIINDLAAIARSIPAFDADCFEQICGPAAATPRPGPVSVIGLGTGLGLSLLINCAPFTVIPCEGGHADFPPHSVKERALVAALNDRFNPVSWERLVSGSALRNILRAQGTRGDDLPLDERDLWRHALGAGDSGSRDVVEMILSNLGSAAGDFALIQGAESVVVAGGLANRLSRRLLASGFVDRFIAKDRMSDRLSRLPVHLLTRDDAGLVGAAAWLGSAD